MVLVRAVLCILHSGEPYLPLTESAFCSWDSRESYPSSTLDMLSVKVTVEATFPDACLCCVIALADISMYPSNTTIAHCSSVFPLQVSTIQVAHYFCKSENILAVWPLDVSFVHSASACADFCGCLNMNG